MGTLFAQTQFGERKGVQGAADGVFSLFTGMNLALEDDEKRSPARSGIGPVRIEETETRERHAAARQFLENDAAAEARSVQNIQSAQSFAARGYTGAGRAIGRHLATEERDAIGNQLRAAPCVEIEIGDASEKRRDRGLERVMEAMISGHHAGPLPPCAQPINQMQALIQIAMGGAGFLPQAINRAAGNNAVFDEKMTHLY
jgi:hypothetical protein